MKYERQTSPSTLKTVQTDRASLECSRFWA